MSVRDRDLTPYAIILAEFRQDRSSIAALIEQSLETAALRDQEARPPVAHALLNALALAVHHVYSAVEACLEKLAKYLDEHVPDGVDWHADLLRQMSLDVPDLRPAVISPELRRRLDEYRRFRHVVRKGYEHEFEWTRMKPLVDQLPELRVALETAFDEFEQFLRGAMAGASAE